MAHTSCPSGHSMWNGDGKPVVYAFRINFFKDFVKKYPYFQLGNDEYLSQIYDCVDGIRGEDLDCWYCDECKGLVVFVNHIRYNFKIMDKLPEINMDELLAWEEYIALRDHDFDLNSVEIETNLENDTVTDPDDVSTKLREFRIDCKKCGEYIILDCDC